MKYEMIFGDQSLFDNASDGAVLAIKDTTSGRIHFFTNKGWIKSGLKHERYIGTSDNEIAMRRIIKDKVDDENELENLYWEFDSQRSKKTTDERLLFKGKLRYYASIASVDKSTKEPNRWTWEDKKAGRLPDVGAELIHKTRGICYFVGIGVDENACWALKLQSGLIYIAEKSWCSPIETPEERAKREREEWCSKALDSAGILSEMKRYELKRLGEYIGSIHDALLSGELKAPEVE